MDAFIHYALSLLRVSLEIQLGMNFHQLQLNFVIDFNSKDMMSDQMRS